MSPTLRLAQHPDADRLLSSSPLALLIGMLLDQQVPMEKAFSGPYELARRLGHEPDADEIAGYDTDALVELFSERPAIHRFPGAMAKRVQELCRYLRDHYDGDAAAVWADAATGQELLSRLKALPGYGEQKASIFLALLGKQLEVRPEGWREAAGGYGQDGSLRSVADITGPDSLAAVRDHKRQAKQADKQAKQADKQPDKRAVTRAVTQAQEAGSPT